MFTVNPSNGNETVLHNFGDVPDGNGPLSNLIYVKGKLYGTTEFGGNGGGVVFRITTDGAETVLYSFNNQPDGNAPMAGVVLSKGKLYGTTYQGGSLGKGSPFGVTLKGREQVLHNFGDDGDGYHPEAPLLPYKGQLYGTTYAGGATGGGAVFRIDRDGTNEVLVHSFGQSYANDGGQPIAGLIIHAGALYGTTFDGGLSAPSCSDPCDWGTVFKLVVP